eukprot:scaffold3784_cov174-Amphora_coffeaeformis.AAC.8
MTLPTGYHTVDVLTNKRKPEILLRWEDEIFEDPRFKKHARTVIAMVDTAIQLLEAGDTKTLFSALHQLGARHASYKVEQHHYPIVGQALILTLEAALGDAFTVEVKKQWVATASQIFNAMVTSW